MKLNKEDLEKYIKEIVLSVQKDETNGLNEIIKNTISDYLKEQQNTLVVPEFSAGKQFAKLNSGIISGINGDYITTSKGSILNVKNKSHPWVSASEEMKSWTEDFISYIKSKQVSKLLSSTSDPSGGFTVPEEFRQVMLMYDFEDTLIWQRATVWPMAAQKVSFPKLMQNPDVDSDGFDHFAGVSFEWIEEASEKPETEPNFGLLELIVHELAGYTEISNALLEDSFINFLNYLTRIFRAAWYWTTDKAFLTGTGGKQPLGILNDPNILTVFRKTASNINIEDVLNMEAKLPSVFDANAVWFTTKKGLSNLRGQKTTEGTLILQESYREFTTTATSRMLAGRPVYVGDGKIPALGNYGDLVLADWRFYYIGFREDFMMDSSSHYQFRKNRTALRCSGRIDGQAAVPFAFVALSDATS